jgi:hypothetical protein
MSVNSIPHYHIAYLGEVRRQSRNIYCLSGFLGGLPWKPYKGAVGEWIFSNLNSAQQLLKAIREAPEKQLIIGKYRYQIHRNGEFIGRVPT